MSLPGGQILLPGVFGFCRGVERALEMLEAAVNSRRSRGVRLFLLGEVIHNPWVNKYFEDKGVRILRAGHRDRPEGFITQQDCAVIPAFGVPLIIEQRIKEIGCEIVDTTCGDVRRLWRWASRAVADGYGVLIFGRAQHDETVVTKSRLAAMGGKYVVAGNLDEVKAFASLVTGRISPKHFSEVFGTASTNADSIEPFGRLAQVSQTTMLYNDTMEVRETLRQACVEKYGEAHLSDQLLLQETVCRATQARQSAAVELCQKHCDLVIVVGGFSSSNTLNLYKLAAGYCPSHFIESAENIKSPDELVTYDFDVGCEAVADGWLPKRRPLRIGVLAGASSPEIVVGKVIEKLAGYLS